MRTFILEIPDTDSQVVEASVRRLLQESLDWLSLIPNSRFSHRFQASRQRSLFRTPRNCSRPLSWNVQTALALAGHPAGARFALLRSNEALLPRTTGLIRSVVLDCH